MSSLFLIKKALLLLIAFIQFENIKFFSHDYYVSTTQVDYLSEKNTLQITIRMFIDDFEIMIQENNSELKVDPDSSSQEINKILDQYVIEKFKIFVNQQLVIFNFIGKEYKTDLIQVYYEVDLIESIKSIAFENHLLFDFFDDQQNIIHFKKNKFRKSFLLKKNNPKTILLLK